MKYLKKIKELWDKLPFRVRDYTISSVNTFIATFLLVVALQLQGDVPVQFTSAGIGGLLMMAFRASVRATARSVSSKLK